MSSRKLALKSPAPGIPKMLDLQTALIEHESMPDDCEVTLEAKATPPVPTVYVKSATGRVIVKISPMRNSRYRVAFFAKSKKVSSEVLDFRKNLYLSNFNQANYGSNYSSVIALIVNFSIKHR